MLDALRKSVGSWAAKILIGLLVMSFAVWGVSNELFGTGNNSVAKVGKTEITALQFQEAYQRELDSLSRRIGQPISMEQGAAFGVPTQVLSSLITEAAINDEATALQLGASDAAVIKAIQENPAFQGLGGGFDRNQLLQVLRSVGISEDDFVVLQRQQAERQQLIDALVGNVSMPKPFLEAFYRHQNEQRVLDYIVLTDEVLSDIPQPTEEELAAFYEDTKQAYRAPEYRTVSFIELTPETLAEPSNVSEDEIADEYERTKNNFVTDEQRRIFQLAFPTKEEAQAVVDAIAGGKTFEEVMSERGVSEADVDLGTMSKSGFLDPKIAEAAFALEKGKSSDVVEGQFTNVVLFAKDILPASTKPLEEVADELRQAIATDIAASEVQNMYDTIEDARAGGSTLPEVAERLGLSLTKTVAFDQSGNDKEAAKADIPQVEGFLSDVFESDVGLENDPLEVGRLGYLWFEVDEVEADRDRALEEVHDKVVADWTANKTAELLKEKSEALLAELKGGKALSDIARDNAVIMQTSKPITRNTQDGVLSAAAIETAFTGPKGTSGAVDGNNSDRLLISVKDVIEPVYFASEALNKQMSNELQNSLINQYATQIQREAGVRVNQVLLGQLSGIGREEQ
ncbi:peptidylprolyl isomerase [Rhodobacteraceae bacterium RKSG542]|uniref:SurA N-terminal domain-containing protein n=1 Tax=Pseudovibrio flavus TaxID=2529854 RepID=UPI0012BD3BB0|nr:SurA N-terminal domain-containing protein [Pseudovibrio flavus]MTI16648.1 peptidylprolyl isomerase [Pseudovibrio flavus]